MPAARSSGAKNSRIVSAHDLLRGIALDALRARVPARHRAVRIEHVDRVVGDALHQQAEIALAVAQLRDRMLGLGGLRRRAAAAQERLDRLAALDLVLGGAIEPRVVDGDGGVRGDAFREHLMLGGEAAGLRMAEEQSAHHLARARHHGYREIGAHRRTALAVARVLGDVVEADNRLAREGRREHFRVARHLEGRGPFLRRAGYGAFARRVPVVVEKRTEGRAGEFGCRVGHDLDRALQVQLGSDLLAHPEQDLEPSGFFAAPTHRCH